MGISGMKKILFLLAAQQLLIANLFAQTNATPPPLPAPAAPGASASPNATVTTSPSRIYIPVGDPNVKKALLAVEPTLGAGAFSNDFFKTLKSNMDFIDLFTLLPEQ